MLRLQKLAALVALKDGEARKLADDLRFFKSELVNRETNYNKTFSRSPVVAGGAPGGSASPGPLVSSTTARPPPGNPAASFPPSGRYVPVLGGSGSSDAAPSPDPLVPRPARAASAGSSSTGSRASRTGADAGPRELAQTLTRASSGRST